MASPSYSNLFFQALQAGEQDYLNTKKEIWKRLNQSSSYYSKQVKIQLNIFVTETDFLAYAKARFNPGYGIRYKLPADASTQNMWRYDQKVEDDFKNRFGQAVVTFIDFLAVGNSAEKAKEALLDRMNEESSVVLKKCAPNLSSIEAYTKSKMKVRQGNDLQIKSTALSVLAKFKNGSIEGDYDDWYYSKFGVMSERNERPKYREIMEFKAKLLHKGLAENRAYLLEFYEKYPNTATNLDAQTNIPIGSNDPVLKHNVEEAKAEWRKEVSQYNLRNKTIEEYQAKLTAFEVYAFNTKISELYANEDRKLDAKYDQRNQMEAQQVNMLLGYYERSASSLEKRNQELEKFMTDIQCRLSNFPPWFLRYGQILKDDLFLKSTALRDVMIEGMCKVLDKCYPSASEYFTKDGKTKYPFALGVMEDTPFPDPIELDKAFRYVMGWGTPEYAEARFAEYTAMVDELKKRTSEFFGDPEFKLNKGYFHIVVKDFRPSFPYVGPWIRKIHTKTEFYSATPKDGYTELSGIGYINFAQAPQPLSLGLDIEMDFKEYLQTTATLKRLEAEKVWQEKNSKTFLGKVHTGFSWVADKAGEVVKNLNPISIFVNALRSNPLTAHLYKEMEKITGGLLTQLNQVAQLPGRIIKDEDIKTADLLAALDLALKAGMVAFTGGTSAAYIGVASGQLRKGTLGKTAFGNTLLRIVEIGAYAYASGQKITQYVQEYGTTKAREAAQLEVLKKTGLDKTVLGAQFGAAVFSALGSDGFNPAQIVEETFTESAIIESGKKLEDITAGVVSASTVRAIKAEAGSGVQATPKAPNEIAIANAKALKEIDHYAKKSAIIEKVGKGKLPSVKELKMFQPEAAAFLVEARKYIPEGQLPEAMSIGFKYGFPKFNTPNWGLPDINLPKFSGLAMPDWLKFNIPPINVRLPNMPGGAGWNIPDLPKLGISLPKMPNLSIPMPDIKIPKVDLERIIRAMLPSGVPLYPALSVDPYYFNFIDPSGNITIRPERGPNYWDHPMLVYGLIPEKLTAAEIAYDTLRQREFAQALARLKEIEDAQKKAEMAFG